MKSPALVKVRIGRGSDPTVKGGLKAVNARIDGLEWKMDGEFRQSTRKSGHRQGLLGFGASAMRFGAALCRAGFIAPPPDIIRALGTPRKRLRRGALLK